MYVWVVSYQFIYKFQGKNTGRDPALIGYINPYDGMPIRVRRIVTPLAGIGLN